MSKLKRADRLRVSFRGRPGAPLMVGELAYQGRRALFEYSAEFLDAGLELSPFHLPLQSGVQQADPGEFDGLFGLFDDSLPDGWGRLLLDRYVAKLGARADELTPLDRLAWVGDRAIGALSYEPATELESDSGRPDLHALAAEAQVVLEDRASKALPELLRLGGSPQGARPKVLIHLGPDGETVRTSAEPPVDFTPYLVKFPARSDPSDVTGAIEYAYSLMARAAGIDMPTTRLLAPKGKHRGYFAIERFDWTNGQRRHVHTVSGLLDAPPGLSFVSYDQVMRLTWQLTRDARDVLDLLRRAAFNVFAHNRDDHSRNLAFTMHPNGEWRLAPAYDLTFSSGPGGEHTMSVAGEARAPRRADLERLGREAGLKHSETTKALDQVADAVSRFGVFAAEAGVTKKHQAAITKRLRPR